MTYSGNRFTYEKVLNIYKSVSINHRKFLKTTEVLKKIGISINVLKFEN